MAITKKDGRAIYLDMQATSPIDPRVLDNMMPFMTEAYGNPHSNTHSYGWEAHDVVEQSREVGHAIIFSKISSQLRLSEFRSQFII